MSNLESKIDEQSLLKNKSQARALKDFEKNPVEVEVWKDYCEALPAREEINRWFSDFQPRLHLHSRIQTTSSPR